MNKWLIKVGLGLALGLAVTTGVGQAKALPTVTPDPNASQIPWTYDQSTYKAGIETYRITRGEVMKGNHGKRYLLIHCIVTNNSDKEQTPSNIYMVVKAYQTVNGNDEQLSQSVVPVKKNGKNPYQAESDGLNNSLKPGKSKRAVMVFELKNQADVQVKFENSEQTVIGVEKFTLGKQVKHQTVKTGEETGTQATTATNTNQATTANQANGSGNGATSIEQQVAQSQGIDTNQNNVYVSSTADPSIKRVYIRNKNNNNPVVSIADEYLYDTNTGQMVNSPTRF